MLAYFCKYAPIEIFEAMGEDVQIIDPQVVNFNQADILMHPNICSFVKGTLEDFSNKDYEGMILTSCCDSVKRLYDTLKKEYPDKFIYMLDIPRVINDYSFELYKKRVIQLIEAYEEFSGKYFDKNKIKDILEKNNKENSNNKDKKLKIGILGARSNENIVKIIEENNCEVIFNITCTGMERNLSIDDNNILDSYIKSVLNQTPCMRMEEANKREEFVRNFEGKVDGIICHTVQFCDNYSYEYADFKQKLDIPILLLETDCTKQCEGQIKTRVEAFLESLAVTKGISIKDNKKMKINKNGDIYVLGVDSGSTSTNAVIMDKNKKIIAHDVIRTGAKSMESAEKVLESVLKKANLKKEDLSLIVSTGYGRVSIVYADESVTEISCHGKGAHYFNPSIRTILDIGGQDSKAIKLNEKGEVIDFVMNDKCAAGTGRFLEMMAKTLEISIGELGPISFNSKENIEITSMCSVFAESEVISLIAQNKEKSDIANGVHNAIASKSYSLLKRVGFEKEFMMTGGVAKNPGVVKAVEDKIGSKLYTLHDRPVPPSTPQPPGSFHPDRGHSSLPPPASGAHLGASLP